MKNKLIKFLFTFFLFTFFFVVKTSAQAPPVGDWWGVVQIDGVNATNGTIVTAHLNNSLNITATAYVGAVTEWYYLIHVEGNNVSNVTFKVCGIDAYPTNETPQVWSAGDHSQLNLSITTLSDGSSCTYDCGCSGGFCVHGYCRSSSTYCGDGYCDSGESCSSCSPDCGTCPSTGGPSYAGGGGGPTPPPKIEETKNVSLILAYSTTTFTFTKSDDLKIQEIGLEVKENAANVSVTIKEGSKPIGAPEPVTVKGKVYKYLEISKANIQDSNINRARIKFKVEKSWLRNNSFDPSNVRLKRWYNNQWNDLQTTKISEDVSYAYFEAESPGLSIFAITAVLAEEVVVTRQPCPFDCCINEANYFDKSCPPEYQCQQNRCVFPSTPKQCLPCPEPTNWTDCYGGKKTRAIYVCSSETNYNCKVQLEVQDCEMPGKVSWIEFFFKYWWVWLIIGIVLFCILWPWEPLIRI